ncbi:multicopper oxidase family protein [Corynebacterium guangdongense]|uniref:FtsP/CotA-like multicopper oxidase with cupredoxin domain n=1 Tax=Corynebacterium guangdongense TaxID=1783348 RepID=A0ABU1ZVF4_9CORY|nr:multicopper oxidase domain-containing protein [Corynebacterium guangdongense]MDR7328901.1 FtsP/CotA-like multicopper oxidase with cupredoxin domain [Corynebacterium guangdongense]WJZ17476.1 Multicopper oxidase mco [Corynebacterium guangdongense]
MTVISRRVFFRGMVGVFAASALAACSTQTPPRGYDGDTRPLPVPELYESTLDDAGTRHFTLKAQPGSAEILPDVRTETWGFNGGFLGPTLRAHRGDHVRVDIANELDTMTTVHWHGMKLPAWADGGPHSPIEPGGAWSPEWEIIQPAATLWYHPHPHGETGLHCYRGLAGMIILDDEVSESVALPSEYGVDDVPLVILDAKFTGDGQLDESIDPDLGLIGDTPVVNGITNAHFDAATRRVRFRVLDGATMRFYNLAFSDHRPFHVVGTDQGLLETPVQVEYVLMGPGERVEIVVDLEPGEDVRLQSQPLDGNFGLPEDNPVDFGFQDAFDLLTIHGPSDDAPAPGPLPQELDPAAAAVPERANAVEREFVLNTFQINGRSMDMSRVDVTVDRDRPEIWRVTNENADWPHNFHIHDCRFKVLEFDNNHVAQVATYGWKDTVAIPPRGAVTLGVEFGWYPDPSVPYMFHCHMLFHEDSGMMGQFVIVEQGQEADLKPMSGGGSIHDHA